MLFSINHMILARNDPIKFTHANGVFHQNAHTKSKPVAKAPAPAPKIIPPPIKQTIVSNKPEPVKKEQVNPKPSEKEKMTQKPLGFVKGAK